MEEPDSHFEWLSPDEAVRLPFSRSRDDAVQLAVQYDLCFGGDALHHVEQIGAAPLFVPLTQVIFDTVAKFHSLLPRDAIGNHGQVGPVPHGPNPI